MEIIPETEINFEALTRLTLDDILPKNIYYPLQNINKDIFQLIKG